MRKGSSNSLWIGGGGRALRKKKALTRFVNIGAQWQPPQAEVPGHFGPYIVEENLVEALVEGIRHPDPDLRNKASEILARETPDSQLRNFSTSIESTLVAFPELSGAALILGKLGSERALRILSDSVMVLAQDLRSPFAYEWNQKAKRTFRIHVIAALSVAYPKEVRLWKPFYTPSDDSYYAQIETWAEKVLGVKWSAPRPPFLYEEQVPMARP